MKTLSRTGTPFDRRLFAFYMPSGRMILAGALFEDESGILPVLWVGGREIPVRLRYVAEWLVAFGSRMHTAFARAFAPGTPGWFLAALLVVVAAPALLLWGLLVVGAPR